MMVKNKDVTSLEYWTITPQLKSPFLSLCLMALTSILKLQMLTMKRSTRIVWT